MTKEMLEEFLKIKSDYLIAKETYNYLLASMPSTINLGKVKGSDTNFPYCERSFTIDGIDEEEIAKHQKKIDNAKIDMNNKKRKYEELKVDVEVFIIQVPNARHREILRMIYIDDVKKVDVARRCHYSQPRITQIINEYTQK